MKRKILCMLLALTLVLAMFPVKGWAAAPETKLELSAIPVEDTELQSRTYPITFEQNEGGTIICDVTEYEAYDYVYFTIKADPGYYVDVVELEYEYWMQMAQFEFCGFDLYRLKTSDGKSKITVTFTKLSGPEHEIAVEADEHCTWKLDRTSAQHHETFYLEVEPHQYYNASTVDAVTADGQEVEMYVSGDHPNRRYEFHMPDEDVLIRIETSKGIAHSIQAFPFNEGGTVSLSTDRASYGDVVQMTILPEPGYRPLYIVPYGAPGWNMPIIRYIGNNIWNVTMPDNEVTIQVSFEASENPFMDVKEDDFYYDSVLWALEAGITNGTDLSHFAPEDTCLRSQVVTFLWRAAGEPKAKTAVNPFVDVKPSDYYYDAVLWAVEQGITTGADATHFEPNGVCNRSQVVTFLYRAFEQPPVDSAENPFTDVSAGDWYASAVLWAVQEGITNGLSANKFGPNDLCNRSQVVTFLHRAYVN